MAKYTENMYMYVFPLFALDASQLNSIQAAASIAICRADYFPEIKMLTANCNNYPKSILNNNLNFFQTISSLKSSLTNSKVIYLYKVLGQKNRKRKNLKITIMSGRNTLN